MEKKVLTTPIQPEDLADINVGDVIYLTGYLTTCRGGGARAFHPFCYSAKKM